MTGRPAAGHHTLGPIWNTGISHELVQFHKKNVEREKNSRVPNRPLIRAGALQKLQVDYLTHTSTQ